MFDLDLRVLGAAAALLVLATVAFALHTRGARGDARAWAPEGAAVDPRTGSRRGRTYLLRLAGLACLVLAAASPALRARATDAGVEPTLVLVLDVSMSMRAADLVPTRLDEAKRQITAGVDAAFGGRLAIVAFAAEPTLVCPPTTDRAAFGALLDATTEDAAAAGLSQAGPAVARALALLGDAGGDVLLVSDGEFPDRDRQLLQELARDAVRRDVRISTLGAGTAAGAPVPVRGSGSGQVQLDQAGLPLPTRLDAALLRWLAREGGGQYLELQPGGQIDLVAMTERLRLSGATTPARLHPFGPVSLFGYPLALGLALLCVDAWIAWRRGRG